MWFLHQNIEERYSFKKSEDIREIFKTLCQWKGVDKRRTCAWLVVLGLCPKLKNHPLGRWIIIILNVESNMLNCNNF